MHYGKVEAKLEAKKINYIIIDPRNNYDVEEKCDNRNLNTYEEEVKKAYVIEQQKRKINKLKEELEKHIGKEDFKTITKKVEEILNENRKI